MGRSKRLRVMRQRQGEGLGPGQRGEVESGGVPGLTCVFNGSSDCCMENRAGDRGRESSKCQESPKSHLLALQLQVHHHWGYHYGNNVPTFSSTDLERHSRLLPVEKRPQGGEF